MDLYARRIHTVGVKRVDQGEGGSVPSLNQHEPSGANRGTMEKKKSSVRLHILGAQ